ncbi:MAG: CNNM domain-containing protein [Planctomycetota bacterium]
MDSSLFGLLALLFGSAWFAGAEASLFTLASVGSKSQGVPVVARRLMRDQVGVLTTILCTNLSINLAYFAASHRFASNYAATTATLIQLGAVLVIVMFGEILPKVLGNRHPRVVGSILLVPVGVLYVILGPILRPFGRRWAARAARPEPLDTAQAADLLEEGEAQILDSHELDLVSHLLELGELRAGALRLPLSEVPQVAAMRPLRAELRRLETEDIPWAAVTHANGEVVGILDRARLPKGILVRDAMGAVPVLPEVAPVANGVQLLAKSGTPFVLLVDEYGQSAGIIQRGRWADTLLDRLSAADLAGRAPIRVGRAGHWEVEATLPLHDFEDRFGDPGVADVRVDTIGGLVAEKLGRMAEVGDTVVSEQDGRRYTLTVLTCSETRPLSLEVSVEDVEEEIDPEGEVS